jgi:hypothetical protein
MPLALGVRRQVGWSSEERNQNRTPPATCNLYTHDPIPKIPAAARSLQKNPKYPLTKAGLIANFAPRMRAGQENRDPGQDSVGPMNHDAAINSTVNFIVFAPPAPGQAALTNSTNFELF